MENDPSASVPLDEYTEAYYRDQVGGVEFFEKFGFQVLKPDTQAAVLAADLKSGNRILDVGCGRGELVSHLAQKGFDILGVDYADEAIKIARVLCPQARFVCGELAALGLGEAAYDVVFLVGTIQHLTATQILDLLHIVRRLIRPDGRLVLTTCSNPLYYKQWSHTFRAAAAGALSQVGFHVRSPVPPISDKDRAVHINEQTAASLQAWGRRSGWSVRVHPQLNPKMYLRDLYGEVLPEGFPLRPAPAWKRWFFRRLVGWHPLNALFARNYLAVFRPC